MTPRPTLRRRSLRPRALSSLTASCTATLLVLTLAACGSAAGAGDGDAASTLGTLLAEASPVPEPLDHVGASTAVLVDTAVRPVTEAPQPDLPVTVTDNQGTEVTITDTSRILTLDTYGTLSRIVFGLGLGDSVVGRDVSSGFAEILDRPLVTTGGHDLNAEAILELNPSVILTDTSMGPWDVILQMREAGIPVVVLSPERNLEQASVLTTQVAEALGVPEAGETLAERTRQEVQAKVAEIAAVAPQEQERRLRMVFLYVRGQSGVYQLFGSGSGTDDLIQGLGGVDVATEIGWEGVRPLNDEGLIKAAPDLVLVMSKGLESVGGVDGLLETLPALASTPAGQKRRIVDMDDAHVLSFGPHSADILDALAVAVYAPGQE